VKFFWLPAVGLHSIIVASHSCAFSSVGGNRHYYYYSIQTVSCLAAFNFNFWAINFYGLSIEKRGTELTNQAI
jgi:hypothetical protein